MIDDKRFRKNLSGMGELFGREITDTLASLYWRLFSDWTDSQFEAACQAAANRLKFFPKPAELRELVGGDQEAQALEAWETLHNAIKRIGNWQSVQFEDSRITRVVESMGGWQAVCLWETKDLSYRRHEFLRTYQALKDGGPLRAMAGLIEQENVGRGRLEFVPQPVQVGGDNGRKQIEESAGKEG